MERPRALTLEEIKNLAEANAEPKAPKIVRTRFAPSPTGHLHIGGGRTALMNYLFAKRMGGEFVLRVEDTDPQRSKPEYTEAIKDGLRWLGIEWKGEIVFQSRRTELYRQKAQELVEQKKAYRDETGAIFFKMPVDGELVVEDRVKGRVVVPVMVEQGTKDFPILRADGTPTFLLANVVDDGEMQITHVIRGDDHLTNAARQICLFKALGYPIPEFYHVPLIHGDDGAKLSKRHGATSVIEYKTLGYDPTVVVNHLARLGMSFGTEATLAIDDLAQRCDPYAFSKAPSRLGLDRLAVRNMHRLKKMDLGELAKEIEARTGGETVRVHVPRVHVKPNGERSIESAVGEAPNLLRELGKAGVAALADAARGRATTFMEVIELGQFLKMPPAYSEDDVKRFGAAKAGRLVDQLRAKLEGLDAKEWTLGGLEKALEAFNREARTNYKEYNEQLRWALTGSSVGIPINHTLAIIGRDAALDRLAGWPRSLDELRAMELDDALEPDVVFDDAPVIQHGEAPQRVVPEPQAMPPVPEMPVAVERPKDRVLVRNGAPIEHRADNEASIAKLARLKNPLNKLAETSIADFRPELLPAEADATALVPEAQQKPREALAWTDLNDKGKALYLTAYQAAHGNYPALAAIEGGSLAKLEYADGGWIRWSSKELDSVAGAHAFLAQHGWGPVSTSFVRGDAADVREQQVAWLRNANLYLFLAALEARGAKANGEEFWRFAVGEYNLPAAEHLQLAAEILGGADAETTPFSKQLQVSLQAGEGDRAIVETRAGNEAEKQRVLDSLMNGLANGQWGGFIERFGHGGFELPALNGAVSLPDAFRELIAARGIDAAAAQRMFDCVASARFYAGDAPERRVNGFDQRATLPLLDYAQLPWLTEEEKQRAAAARDQFIAQLDALSRPGAYEHLPKEQLGLQITQLIHAWSQAAQLAEPFGRWLDGPERRVFFEADAA